MTSTDLNNRASAGIEFLYRVIKRVHSIDAMLVVGHLIVELLKIAPDWTPEEK